VLPVLFVVTYVTDWYWHGEVGPVTAGVGSALTTSVAVCVITVVHAGAVDEIARTLYTYVPALKLPTVNVTVSSGDALVVVLLTTLPPSSSSYVVFAWTGCPVEPTVTVALVTLPGTPPVAQIEVGLTATGRSSGNEWIVTVSLAVPVQPLPSVTTTVTVAEPPLAPKRIVA
jgi:hypothetical protein